MYVSEYSQDLLDFLSECEQFLLIFNSVSMENTRSYHSTDLKPVFLKNGDQRKLNPLLILTFHLLT